MLAKNQGGSWALAAGGNLGEIWVATGSGDMMVNPPLSVKVFVDA